MSDFLILVQYSHQDLTLASQSGATLLSRILDASLHLVKIEMEGPDQGIIAIEKLDGHGLEGIDFLRRKRARNTRFPSLGHSCLQCR